jgi:hypothetical protein
LPAGAALPEWPSLTPFVPQAGFASISSKDVEVIHSPDPLGGFVVRVSGHDVAFGSEPAVFGYLDAGELHWLNCASVTSQKRKVEVQQGELVVSYECADTNEAIWKVTARFRPHSVPGAIEVQTVVGINQDRSIAFIPMLLVFPGVGSFGTSKNQGLFAGLEYLENEPSSSGKDVIGPASRRQVPDDVKITFPLMAIQSDERYVAVSWQMRPYLSAVFDSPDRLFHSGGHVMGVLFPGSNGKNRVEGNPLPRRAELVRAGQTITLRATIFGGKGQSVVPSVRHFCQLRQPPSLPPSPGLETYIAQAASGWLDSKIRQTNLVRHAVAGGGFPPQPASDAALWMQWLAMRDPDPIQRERLIQKATNLVSVVAPENINFSGVGHIRYPVEALVFGHVAENAEHALREGKGLLARFEPDGSVKYHPNPGGLDYSKTHFTNEASGLTSRVVVDLLEAATFSGDRQLLVVALTRLRDLDRFHNGVPRGAQTWECPLHTPDILASAQMVRAYTLGYELTREDHFLEEARYWAWTGVPFVYLVNPTEQSIGLYATIAVFGATQWKAPVWLGLPVQWCGLVYADALYRLAESDPGNPWKQIADGITISGIQQSWPTDEAQLQGLLPDSFVLRDQKRNGPAINPATVEACASRYFGRVPVYDFHCFQTNGVMVHAPGRIEDAMESGGRVSFQVQSWVKEPYYVLVSSLKSKPRIRINEQQIEYDGEHQFIEGRLILRVNNKASITLDF